MQIRFTVVTHDLTSHHIFHPSTFDLLVSDGVSSYWFMTSTLDLPLVSFSYVQENWRSTDFDFSFQTFHASEEISQKSYTVMITVYSIDSMS